jgi:hypothetical protein
LDVLTLPSLCELGLAAAADTVIMLFDTFKVKLCHDPD